MKQPLLFTIVFALGSICMSAHADGDVNSGKEKSASCAGCHGEDGNSQVGTFPKLAGQHASYLVKQLKAFQSKSRNDPMMSSIAASLSEPDMNDIAAFYANQKLAPAQLPALEGDDKVKAQEEQDKLIAEGRHLYRYGDLNTQVSACISCHGPYGDGNKPASFPVVKAQHSDYLIKTLSDFKTDARSNNPENMMHMIAKKLSEREIKAVSYYLSTLK